MNSQACRALRWMICAWWMALCLVAPPLASASPMRETAIQEGRALLSASDGTPLHVRVWRPSRPPQAVVLALHGMNDHGGSFERPARAWALAGIATYAPDIRGSGLSGTRGHWAGTPRLVADVHELIAAVRRRHTGTPVVLLGESLGGALATVAASRSGDARPDALLLLAPAYWGDGLGSRMTLTLATVVSGLLPGLTVGPIRHAVASTDDPAMRRRQLEDPLIQHRTRLDTLRGVLRLMAAGRREAARLAPPTLILYGGQDRHVPRRPLVSVVRRLDGRVQLGLYPEGRHLLLRSLGSGTMLADTTAWMLAPGTSLPSGADDGSACVRVFGASSPLCRPRPESLATGTRLPHSHG